MFQENRVIPELLLALIGIPGDLFVDSQEQEEYQEPSKTEKCDKYSSQKKYGSAECTSTSKIIDYESQSEIQSNSKFSTLGPNRINQGEGCQFESCSVVKDDEQDQLTGEPCSPPASTFKIAQDAAFLQDSHRLVIEDLLPLGCFYYRLDSFATKCREMQPRTNWKTAIQFEICSDDTNHKSKVEKSQAGGDGIKRGQSPYLMALAAGISEILDVYHKSILNIESQAAENSAMVFSSISNMLRPFNVIFPSLYSLVWEVEQKQLRGGALLSALFRHSYSALPGVQPCMERLLGHCHQMMLRQLSALVLQGSHCDISQECFIQPRQGTARRGLHASDPEGSPLPLFSADWQSAFVVQSALVPSYMTPAVVSSMLFVGNSIRILRGANNQTSDNSNAKRHLKNLCRNAKHEASQRDLEEDVAMLVLALNKLQEKPEIQVQSLERVFSRGQALMAQHLWELVVNRADMNGHLQAFKDFFLLAKGDFFQAFLQEAKGILSVPPHHATAAIELQEPFDKAVAFTCLEGDALYVSLVNIRLFPAASAFSKGPTGGTRSHSGPDSPAPSRGAWRREEAAGRDGWDDLGMEFRVEGPLELLFSPDALARYNLLFQHLLRLKRVQVALEDAWACAMMGASQGVKGPRFVERQMWALMQQMKFVITNLQFYLQVDVIEAQWSSLQTKIASTSDFNYLAAAHEQFLTALVTQSFLDMGAVQRILQQMRSACFALCSSVSSSGGPPPLGLLQDLYQRFGKEARKLYVLLSAPSLSTSARAPFLRQLLLRLNFNGFLEMAAMEALTASSTGHL